MDGYSLLRITAREGSNRQRSVCKGSVEEGIVREGNVRVGMFWMGNTRGGAAQVGTFLMGELSGGTVWGELSEGNLPRAIHARMRKIKHNTLHIRMSIIKCISVSSNSVIVLRHLVKCLYSHFFRLIFFPLDEATIELQTGL